MCSYLEDSGGWGMAAGEARWEGRAGDWDPISGAPLAVGGGGGGLEENGQSPNFSCEFMVVQSPGREPWYILGLSGPDPVVMFCCEQAAPEVPFTSVSPPRHPQGPGPACCEQEGQAASLPSRPSSLCIWKHNGHVLKIATVT